MTFPGIVDKELEKADIDVFNAGVVSSSPKVYYLRTKYLLTKRAFHFDELFVFIDISDIQHEIGHEQFTPSDRTDFHRLIHRYLKRHSYIHNRFGTPLLAYLLRKKEVYLYSKQKDNFVVGDVKSSRDEQKKLDLKAFYKNRLKERY